MPIAIVQASETEISLQIDQPTLTLLSPPSSGNAIIVGVTCISDFKINNEGDCGIPSNGGVTDNHGNTYIRVVQGEPIKSSSQGARGYLFIAPAISLGAESPFEIRVNPDGSVPENNQRVVWGAIEVAGLAASSLDAWGSTLTGGTDKTSTTATTDLETSQANSLAVAVLSMRSNDTNMLITPESSWGKHHAHQNGASDIPGHSMVSRILDTTGKVSHTWTHDNPTRGVAAIIATFKGAAP